jgi:Fe-Mn family superoxide dismutase
MTRTLPFDELPGAISKRALAEHLKLWGSYEEASDRVDTQLYDGVVALPNSSAPDLPLRLTLTAQSYATNGDRLHDMFFGNLTAVTARILILLSIEGAIERRWGSQENFRKLMQGAAMATRGWVVFGYDAISEDFRIITLDTHDAGLVHGLVPLLVLDMFEHSYWMDHGADREAYIDALWGYIDWFAVDRRYRPVITEANPYEYGR